MKKFKAILVISLVLCALMASHAFARQSAQFHFDLWFDSGDETKGDMATQEAFRFEPEMAYPKAYVQLFASSTNIARSLKLKVQKITDTGSVTGDATNPILVTGTGDYEIPYYNEYMWKSGNYRLYGWTIKNDCTAIGSWAP